MACQMQKGGGSPPEGNLAKAIDAQFGGLDKVIAKMNAAGAGVQGSGWVVCLTSHLFFPSEVLMI
jgi:superoxide dismutase